MPRTLITGCSSGFGQAIAARFLDQGWDVIATMKLPAGADAETWFREEGLAPA